MRSNDEIVLVYPDEESPASAARAVEELRLGGPLFILFGLIALGFLTVLVPFCTGISR